MIGRSEGDGFFAADTPLVSVVMPVYGADPSHLREAVESLLAQTWPRLEILVVEAGDDRSARRVSPPDPRLHFIDYSCAPSQTDQYNKGLEEARGAFLARADADDVYDRQRIEAQVRFLMTHQDVDVVGSWIDVIDAEGRLIGRREYPIAHEAIVRQLPISNPIANPSVMFRRNLLECGRWEDREHRYARDYDWLSRMALAGARFANLPQYLVRYRIHPGGVKSSKLKDSIRATLAVKRRYWLPMGPVGKVRMWGEKLLLLVPSRWVLWLFMRLSYSRSFRGRTRS